VLQPDQGAEHIASTVRQLKAAAPSLLVECLTPDFRGQADLIAHVARSGLDVFAHNLETVERLQGRVRDRRAGYKQSLGVLETAKAAVEAANAGKPEGSRQRILTKTSLMLGVGENAADLRATLRDIRAAGVDVLTFGQYLRPSKRHMPVDRYVTPEEFDAWRAEGEALGFKYVASGPLVRSSYKAGEYFLEGMLRGGGGKGGSGSGGAVAQKAAAHA
jgi:lipoic acid synthetase